VADRKTVDTACNDVRAASGRDAYLDCLGNQLTVLRSKRARSAPAAPSVQPCRERALAWDWAAPSAW